MRVLLIAAGSGTRWNNYLGVPKHLAPVRGTTVLGRLVSQFQGVADVTVVGPPDDRYRYDGSTLVCPAVRDADADKFLSSRHLWNPDGPTLIVYGDIFLSWPARDLIVHHPDRLALFARWGRARLTGTPYGECFAYRLPATEHDRFEHALWDVDGWQREGLIDRSGGWETFQRLNGAGVDTVRRHRQTSGPCQFVDVNDWSDDFDWPKDYERWRQARQAAGMPV